MLRRLAKPEYFFRPKQLARRWLRRRADRAPRVGTVELPWGLPIEVAPAEAIGGALWRLGVHELIVSEVLWRLVDAGERTVDVGANYGYFSGLMAVRAGRSGVVSAFEPHPQMLARLRANVDQWNGRPAIGRIEVSAYALSDVDGEAALCLPDYFDANSGTAFIAGSQGAFEPERRIRVERRRLDSVLSPQARPAVIKIDVEGHEAQVLAGAGDLLAGRRIRDIVFEEHTAYPSRAMMLLERHGYSIYRLRRTFLRPALERPDRPHEAGGWEAANYLATADPERAHLRMRRLGWGCLLAGRAA